MEHLTLAAIPRDTQGSRAAQHVRRQGNIPAVVYGHGHDPVSVAVKAHEFTRVVQHTHGETVLITLQVAGDTTTAGRTVIIKDTQPDPVSGLIRHVDFQQISLMEKIEVNIPIQTKGEPVGVKQDGGVLEHFLRELEVRCLPTAIPPHVELDVSALGIGDSIHVKELPPFAGDIEILTDAENPVVSVVAPRVEEEEPPTTEETAAEPEVISKGKEEGEGAEGEAAAGDAKGGDKPDEKKADK